MVPFQRVDRLVPVFLRAHLQESHFIWGCIKPCLEMLCKYYGNELESETHGCSGSDFLSVFKYPLEYI